MCCVNLSTSFFFNDTATTEIYTLSLHDALPISGDFWIPVINPSEEGKDRSGRDHVVEVRDDVVSVVQVQIAEVDRKSTRLNSSHANISYAVFCLKKKKK